MSCLFLFLICGGEHRLELVHREAERATRSASRRLAESIVSRCLVRGIVRAELPVLGFFW